MIKRLVLIVTCLALASCGNFLSLREELQEAKSNLAHIEGKLVSPACQDCPVIIVARGKKGERSVHTYRVYEKAGHFQMVTYGGSRYLFAFNDLNNDFQHQPDEPSASVRLPDDFASGKKIANIELLLQSPAVIQEEQALGNLFDLRGMTLGTIDVQLGKLAALDEPRFDPDLAGLGMWQPLRFMKEGYAGIYFLKPFDQGKIPVLFVHGINGSPRDFAAIISRLDLTRYQPWVLYYPSGLELNALGDGLLGMISELHHRYPFKQLHLVAHSMGGLVSRSYLGACAKSGHCGYLRSFTSISSPFGGHSAAQSGVNHAPVVMPVWRSLAPGSSFLRELFSASLPAEVPHHLVFGFQNSSLLGGSSSDGTITLASQLRREAQQQAMSQRGFDEDHISVLTSEDAIAHVLSLLAQN
jgi:uncharacterized alpha/beta hydrolase family protein